MWRRWQAAAKRRKSASEESGRSQLSASSKRRLAIGYRRNGKSSMKENWRKY